jgi:hypothetical protein
VSRASQPEKQSEELNESMCDFAKGSGYTAWMLDRRSIPHHVSERAHRVITNMIDRLADSVKRFTVTV